MKVEVEQLPEQVDYVQLPPSTDTDLTTPSEAAMTPEMLTDLGIRAKGDLYLFIKGVLGFDQLNEKVHRPLCRLLELYDGWNSTLTNPWSAYRPVLRDVFRRMNLPKDQWEAKLSTIRYKGLRRLLIMLPRTWYKTTCVSIGYPLWRGVRDANVRCLLAQNTFDNATAKGDAIGQCVTNNQLFGMLYPDLLPRGDDKWSTSKRCLHRSGAFAEGTFEFVGTKSQVTSRHFNVIIEDDTVAPNKDDLGQDALLPSQEDVLQAIGWHRLVLPLLVDFMKDQVIVVGTRWFELDLLRWVMDNEPGYLVYQRAVREDSYGHPDPKGEITYPARFNEDALTLVAEAMGPYLYSCLYMNTPVRAGDMTFKPEWMKVYDKPPHTLSVYTTVDVATQKEDCIGSPDFNVVLTCGKDMDSGYVYVLDYTREQCNPGRVIEIIFQHQRRFHPIIVGVEKVAYQSTMLYWLREAMRKQDKFFMIKGLQVPRGGADRNIRGLQPVFASGSIFLRADMEALRNELLVYPLGKNDDVAAALGMQLQLWNLTRSNKERTREFSAGINDFDFVIAAAIAQGAADCALRDRCPGEGPLDPQASAWGQSLPVSVFH